VGVRHRAQRGPRRAAPPGDDAEDVLVALAIVLPAALLGGALWAGTRTLRRRGRERALDAA